MCIYGKMPKVAKDAWEKKVKYSIPVLEKESVEG